MGEIKDFNELENVNGGALNAGGERVIAYCKTCGAALKYLGQARVQGGNTGVFKCMNTYYKGPNTKCPEYGKEKYNDEVKF